MGKAGQIQLSFSMIFSIIIIIVTLAVAFYVIRNFVVTGDCVKIQLFYESLDTEADKIWRAASASSVFKREIPSRIEKVCFGDPRELKNNFEAEYNVLERFARLDKNVFLYPGARACDSTLASYKLQRATIPQAFCAPVKGGKVSVTLSKQSSSDALVTIQP